MTIDSDWVEVMKGECPEAFTQDSPIKPKAVYIDGMPMLMAGQATRMWDDLVKRNFAFPVMRYYRMGASTVVLAFDDYKHVPAAKSITQANRSKGKAPFVFGDGQNLESVIPGDYNDRLRNRVYKRRVIDLIVEMLPDCTRLREGQRLVVDYVDCPVLFQVDPKTGRVGHTYMDSIPPMGECDVKFTRWSRMLGDMIAHSIDGDFIPIALMEYEKQANKLLLGPPAGASQRRAPASIVIYRMECRMPTQKQQRQQPGAKNRGAATATVRHGRPVTLTAAGGRIVVTGSDGSTVRVAGSGGAPMLPPSLSSLSSQGSAALAAQQRPAPKRAMEYVNIPLLYEAMSSAMSQCEPSRLSSLVGKRKRDLEGRVGADEGVVSHGRPGGSYMRMVACLIALTGTDFSRKLPQITPKKVWEVLPVRTVWDGLAAAFDAETCSLRVDEACDLLVSALYSLKFCNHVPAPCPATVDGVIAALRRSKLSEKTKAQIPSRLRIEATVRNANWILQYWECRQPAPKPRRDGDAEAEAEAEDEDEDDGDGAWDYTRCFPDPVCAEYGFKLSRGRKNAVGWLDDP